MPRVRKGAARTQARKRILRNARGYFGVRSKHKYQARNALIRGGVFAFHDRRLKKRDFRALWITRINAAARIHEMTYSRMIAGLRMAGIEIDRKLLADLAMHDANAFGVIAEQAKAALKAA